jgi:hypothetical protein
MGGMSKKHFTQLANAIRTNLPDPNSSTYKAELVVFTAIVRDVARVCRTNNPRFDDARFETACGLAQ